MVFYVRLYLCSGLRYILADNGSRKCLIVRLYMEPSILIYWNYVIHMIFWNACNILKNNQMDSSNTKVRT